MRVGVLGCGPAGLMAAHAVRMCGDEVVIYSRKRKSHLFGAQYLHAPIPGVTDRESRISVEYKLTHGTIPEYRRKVYGAQWDGTVSPEDLEFTHPAWDIRETYDRLWTMYEPKILDLEVDAPGVDILHRDSNIDLLINTIPMNMLCREGHQFKATEVIAAGDAPELGINIGSQYHCPPDTVLLNGADVPRWYRISNIFGHTTVEWPGGIKVPVSTASSVTKPTMTNCDCWPKMLRVGRYGEWSKGVLSHSAYYKTIERVSNAATEASSGDNADLPEVR